MMPIIRYLLPTVLLALLMATASADGICDPAAYGAKGDAVSDDTRPLQKAIDACAANGGGQVRLVRGVYVSGPLQLRSYVFLNLDQGAILRAIETPSRFERAFIGWPYRTGEALVSGVGVTDAGIIGHGRIEGQGTSWWDEARAARDSGSISKSHPGVPDSNGLPRPWLVEFYQSTRIVLTGVSLSDAPMWGLVLRYCDNVQIEGVAIDNPRDAPNTDGIDIVSSNKVHIGHVHVSTGDDNIAIKSGLAGFALPAQAASNITIQESDFGFGHGLSIGSETLNGVSHVDVRGVVFNGTDNGVRIKTGRDRGADIGRITLRMLTMNKVGVALSISGYYPSPGPEDEPAQALTPTTPRIHDITVERLVARDARAAGSIIGLPEAPIADLVLRDIDITAQSGLLLRHVALRHSNLRVKASSGPAIVLQRDARLTPPLPQPD
ncbi:glycoside hydrolase family 28 protein [Paludibacterium yongneupense]|uniref:glycoside hydrolase family 28 protein n=1 Tax=Paludibacterium yongneupense TaxID=400061 RepID=UPI000415B5E9|nr:glycosyl hydrolase family 28 protein [Paludibacterium yongneupense]